MLGFGFTAIAAATGIASGSAIWLGLAFAATGLGWWLLMRRDLLGTRAIEANLNAAAAVKCAARARSTAVVCEFLAECRGRSGSARVEITQLQGLLQDAVHRLTTGFNNMHALAVRQQSLALELSGAGADNASVATEEDSTGTMGDMRPVNQATTDKLKVLAEVTEELSRSVSQTVTSLQFEDISRQLLAHTSEQLAALEQMGQSCEALVRDDGIAAAPGSRSLIAESEGALALARRRTSHNPIRQEAMRGGSVELF